MFAHFSDCERNYVASVHHQLQRYCQTAFDTRQWRRKSEIYCQRIRLVAWKIRMWCWLKHSTMPDTRHFKYCAFGLLLYLQPRLNRVFLFPQPYWIARVWHRFSTGCIQGLVGYLKHDDDAIVAMAAQAIQFLSVDVDNRIELLKAKDLIPNLVGLLEFSVCHIFFRGWLQ